MSITKNLEENLASLGFTPDEIEHLRQGMDDVANGRVVSFEEGIKRLIGVAPTADFDIEEYLLGAALRDKETISKLEAIGDKSDDIFREIE